MFALSQTYPIGFGRPSFLPERQPFHVLPLDPLDSIKRRLDVQIKFSSDAPHDFPSRYLWDGPTAAFSKLYLGT